MSFPIQLSETKEVFAMNASVIFYPGMVELIGIEPTTSGLQSQRSPN